MQTLLLPARGDNYAVLIHDPDTGQTAAIDTPEAEPIAEALRQRGWTLSAIWITHHHGDHTAGNLALKAAHGCRIYGPEREAASIPGLDATVAGGQTLTLGAHEARVIDTPGHTLGHISYWFPESQVAFTGDTLFSLGCGRLLEGTAPMMWASLERLSALPDATAIYCGHEYTAANARFALTIEPENAALQARAAEVDRLRAAGRPSLPTTIGLERATNPFLRPDSLAIRARLGMTDASDAAVFAEIRARKDRS